MFSTMSRKILVAVIAIVVLATAPLMWSADRGSIQGVVKSSSGQPLSGAFVKLHNAEDGLTFMVISQAQGRYSLDNLPDGKYTVQAVGNGMQSEFKPVDVAAGKAATADVTLTTAQHAALPNAWPARKNGDVGGNEIWMHQPNTPLVDGDAKAIINTKCMQCHETERIILLRMDHEKWEFTVNRMRDYITEAKLKQLTDEESTKVIDYLAKNYSGDPGAVNAWPPANSRLPRTLMKGDSTKYVALDYRLPHNVDRAPHDLTVDSEGNAWMPDRLGCCLNKFDPRTYEFTTFQLPPAKLRPRLGGAIGRNADATVVWILDAANRRWVSYDTKAKKFAEFYAPESVGRINANTLIVHPNGTVWGAGGQHVLSLDPKTAKWESYDIPYWVKTKQGADGYGMAVSGDGKVWFAERDPSLLGRVDPATGKVDEFEPPIPKAIPRRMGADPAGNIWVGLHNAGKLLKIDYETTKMTVYNPPTQKAAVYSVASLPNGIIWFSEQAADKMARFDPKTGVFTEYPVPTAESDMRRVETDPSNPNRIWWAGDTSDRIGYVEVLN